MNAINQPLQSSNLIDQAVNWLQTGQAVALVTLVNIEGNAPYPRGSQMLVNARGEYVGQISGGCAEAAIADQAVTALDRGGSVTQRYGLDSPFFDIKLPCGSGIDVFIDVSCTLQELLEMQRQLHARQVVEQALHTDLGEYCQRYLPQPRIIILGQGPVMLSLARLAQLTGFESVCLAQDEQHSRNLQVHGFSAGLLHESVSCLAELCDAHTALVSLFHEHEREIDLLQQALATDLFYIGALGSRRTHQARLTALQSLGLDAQVLQAIHGPVGLDIGASTPAEIALSIMAEIVLCRHQQRR